MYIKIYLQMKLNVSNSFLNKFIYDLSRDIVCLTMTIFLVESLCAPIHFEYVFCCLSVKLTVKKMYFLDKQF